MKTKRILIAMSHKLTDDQRNDLQALGFEPVISQFYTEQKLNQLDPHLSAKEIAVLALKLVNEAKQLDCQAISMVGEPTLQFYVWNYALNAGLEVYVSTTQRISTEQVQEDGTVRKVQIFKHVQWRKIEKL